VISIHLFARFVAKITSFYIGLVLRLFAEVYKPDKIVKRDPEKV
jgi:hypothetical protein